MLARCNSRGLSVIYLLILLLSNALAPSSARAAESERGCKPGRPVEPITLRVAFYPYTPDRITLFQMIEEIFECENPGVDVVLVSTKNATQNYYSDDDAAKEGFRFVEADVYEIDTILLADFIAVGKIATIELPFQDFAREAIEAVTRGGKIYGVPRWLCGNFLFYRKWDDEVRTARTWTELRSVLAARKEGLFVDFKGKSTLGEWYLTALSSSMGVDDAQKFVMSNSALDSKAVIALQEILAMCPLGFCRSSALHDRAGYYARAFVRGQAAAFVGYSETIHYGLREAADGCLPTSGCLRESDIAVRALPQMQAGQSESGVGWVDALAIDAGLPEDKKALALAFVKRTVSEDAYSAILAPEWPYSARYLLPARRGITIDKAPLYPAFLFAHQGRHTGTLKGLNKKLREAAKDLDCRLSIDRDDLETLKDCLAR